MNLGNAFARRKQIDAELSSWMGRLTLANKDTTVFRSKSDEKLEAIPGTKKVFQRSYTVEECRSKIDELLEEDRNLALRISLTNQIAKAKIKDLDGTEKEFSVPALLVLKNEIGPKIENYLRRIPKRTNGVDVISEGDNHINWRSITPQFKKEQMMSDGGNIAEKTIIDYYNVEEVQDFGIPERQIFDEVDKLQEWMSSIKEAINIANDTDLVEL